MFEQNNPGLFQNGKDNLEEPTCLRCGVCCTKYQANPSLAEAQHIAKELGLDWNKFLDEYIDHKWPGINNLLLRHVNGTCIFFRQVEGSRKATCLIYLFRPASCKDWMPGMQRRECQEGLAKYWGLTVYPSGKLKGQEERIKRFQSFLQFIPS